MVMYEHNPVKVTLLVEVDGHTLRFEENGTAKGGRWKGANPRDSHFAAEPGNTLEASVRGCVDTQAAKAVKRANEFVANAFPVAEPTPAREITRRPIRDNPQA